MLVEPPSGHAFRARAPLGHRDGTLLAGEGALVMIRPTGVRLCPNGSDGSDGSSGPNGQHLSGRVTDVAFRGRGYEHAIDVSDSIRLTGVFADVKATRGETVGLRLDPAGCHVFPAEEQNR
jgi:iron(III) transport system ATP-binding protein